MSVCVVIPAYNAEASIHKALDSVLRQTTPAEDILVVDDGSQDRTCEIVSSYGSPVRLISQRNQGPSAARNLGVQSTVSDFIAFLDADDSWDATKLGKQLLAFQNNPSAILCYTGLLKTGTAEGGSIHHALPSRFLTRDLRLGNPSITPSCVMISRAAYLKAGGFSDSFKGSEDWELWIRLSRLGPFCVVEEPLTIYQVNNTGLSSNADHMLSEAKRMMETHLLAGFNGVERVIWRRRILSYQNFRAGMTARASHERSKELCYILHSIRLWPSPFWHLERYKSLLVTLRNRLR